MQGAKSSPAISAATVVKIVPNNANTTAAGAGNIIPQGGRLAYVSVTTAGSTVGTIYDDTTVSSPQRPIFTIPDVVGFYTALLPVSYGITVVPGTSQVVTVSYS